MKVTLVPAHIVVPGFTVILTEVGMEGFTVIVSVLLVAMPLVTQVKEVVNTQ